LLRALTDLVAKAEEALLAAIMVGMVLLALAQILMRNILNQGLLWADPLLRHAVLWLAFLGALYGTKHGRHLSLDALSQSLSPRLTRVTHVISHLTAAVASLGLAWASYRLVSYEAAAASVSSVGVHTWWLQAPMPVCLGLMGIRFLIRTWQAPARGGGETRGPATDTGSADQAAS
jgi:TRAP-type C4-dicarboxylate transport system permease small subunit